MNKSLRIYLRKWDPMGFITRDGAPMDEYDQEADEIDRLFNLDATDDELAKLIHNVFVDFMGIDPGGFLEECHKRSSEIKLLLLSKK